MTQHVVVTGANGFVGQALSRTLLQRGNGVIGLVRRANTVCDGVDEWVLEADDFGGIEQHWPVSIQCDTVVHLAARVHVLHDGVVDPLGAYRKTNVAGTLSIARAARRAGARRFVFVSSVKALAEVSPSRPLHEKDRPVPTDPYGISKLEAERELAQYGRESGLEVVIVRPPLVYGPGVRANFLQLMHTIAKGIPLPLGRIAARRSLVFVDNLTDALVRCTSDARAAGETFHVADADDLTVAELARMLARQLRVPARLLPVPASWLRFAGRMTGRSAQVGRLVSELRLDCSHIGQTLDWRAPYAIDQGLRETAAWYRSTH